MSLFSRVVLGRWFMRWIFRGGPWAIAAKLAGVAAWTAWKWKRENRSREIPAEYEVLAKRDRRTLADASRGASSADDREIENGRHQ